MAKMNFKDALNKSLQTTKKYVDDQIVENKFSGDYNDLENRPCYDDRILITSFTSEEADNTILSGGDTAETFMVVDKVFPKIDPEKEYIVKLNGKEFTSYAMYVDNVNTFEDMPGYRNFPEGHYGIFLTTNEESLVFVYIVPNAEIGEDNRATPSETKSLIGFWDGMGSKSLKVEGMANLFSFLGKSLIISLKAALTTTFELIRGLFDDILTLLDFVFGNTWRNLQDLLGKLGNKLIETLNKAFQTVLSIPGIKQLYEWLSGNTVADTQVITFKFKTDNAKENLTWKDVTSTFDANFKKLVSTYKTEVSNGIAAETKALKEFTSFYSDLTDEAVKQIQEVLAKDLPEDVKQAMVAGIVEAETSSNVSTSSSVAETGTTVETETEKAGNGLKNLTSIIQTLGDVGQAVALALSENWIGLILMLIAKLVSALQNSSDKFSAFMESISEIFSIVAEIIAPIVEQIIQPFLDGIKNLGLIIGHLLEPVLVLVNEVLTPILNLLTQSLDFIAPIVKIVGTLLKLFIQLNPVLNIFGAFIKIFGDILKAVYNYILVPVVNFLLKIITAIGNFFIRMYNGVVGVLNSIEIFGWHPFNFSKKSELDYDSMKLEKISDYSTYEGGNGSNGSSSGSGSSGGSASYTQRDVNVSIFFTNSFVNGDAQEIAIMLAREIKRAEAKNLI